MERAQVKNGDPITYEVGELAAPAEILIDRYGFPHIYAADAHDALFTQGFCIARDCLWQIDLWRRRGLGLLSGVFGSSFVEKDRAARLFLYRGDMRSEWLPFRALLTKGEAQGLEVSRDQRQQTQSRPVGDLVLCER